MISIHGDVSKVQNALAGTSKSIKSINVGVLRIVARGTIKALKSAISASTTRHTGELYNAYKYGLNRKQVMKIYLKYSKSGDKIFPKVYTLNYGKDGTNWKPRSFVQAGESYVKNGNYRADLQAYVDKELAKYWS